jgi:hypothetical protein
MASGQVRIWDEENRQLVIDMLDLGASASKIAAVFDLSRNAVIGRISRDPELHGHVQHQPGIQRIPKQRARRALPPPPPDPPGPAKPRKPVMRLIPLKDLGPNQCRWPVEQAAVAGGHLFCGAGTEAGQVYCPWHVRMAKPERRL